ncbi:MAG: outer membrane protein assembly factor BamA [Opitutaceae bacterium]
MIYRVVRTFCVSIVLAGVGLCRLGAQDVQPSDTGAPTPTYKVGTISVKFVGTANVNEQVVRANIQVREGGDLDETMLDRDIRALYKTGLFEFIEIKREAVNARTFNLVIEVTPKYRILAIKYEGNKQIKTRKLEKEIKSAPNTSLDERQVKEDSEKLKEYYQKEGFNQVSISYTISRDRGTGLGTITFKIREGKKVKILAINFSGNAHIKAKALRGVMETKKWWIFSWLMDTGRFKDDDFQDDLDKLRDYYREHGYLDVEIPEEKIVFSYPKKEGLVITITVHEGRQYRIGEISISGNKLHSTALLKRVAALYAKPGAVFSPSQIDKAVERLEDYYGKDGYLETRVHVTRRPNLKTNDIDLEFKVDESDKYNVESIEIEGNTKTKSVVIIRELVLGPGDVFDSVRMKISKNRLENTRFFDEVDITPQDTNIPGRKDMRVSVKEGRTGTFSFGAGYSTLERATVFAQIQQTNFDLFNRRSLFQGDGEKFSIKVSIGELSNEAVISFEEPYLFEKQLALGMSVFREMSDYVSTYYQELSEGGNVSLRKQLFGLFSGTVTYQYETVSIYDVSPSASDIITEFSGVHRISDVSFELVRDTRDKIVSPTSGNRVDLIATVAGGPLGGTDSYYSLEFKGSQNFKVFDTQTQILELVARSGVIQNYGGFPSIPYYDSFYLGGPYDLRGFEYHEVSPRDPFGEPIGGKTYGMFNAEYSVEIVDPIRFAVFYDVGFVNAPAYDFNPSGYNDDFGFGLRLMVAGSPLSLDYGIPIRGTDLNRHGGQFNFSFGTRF